MDDIAKAPGSNQLDANGLRGIIAATTERLLVESNAHYISAEALHRRNISFTVTIIAMTTIFLFLSNISLFTTSISEAVRFGVGLGSTLTVVLAAIQYALRDQESINQHRLAAVNFSSIRRELELLLKICTDSDLLKKTDEVEQLLARYTIVSSHSPLISGRRIQKAIKRAEMHKKAGLLPDVLLTPNSDP